jgi:hypothetical protein
MSACNDPAMSGSAAMAGGPSTDGTIPFHGGGVIVYGLTGATVQVDGHRHRIGSVRVSIDGQVRTMASMQRSDTEPDTDVTSVTGLPDGDHTLKIEPVGGWIAVNSIKVLPGATPTPSDKPAASAKPDDGPTLGDVPDGYYRLVPVNAPTMTLDVKDNKTFDGTPMQLWTGNTSIKQPNQWFYFTQVSSGHCRITPVSEPGESMSALPGGGVALWHDAGNDAQLWLLIPLANGEWRLSPASQPDLALSLTAGRTDNGAPITAQTWNVYGMDRWRITDQMPR